jgi:hypothetical protein
MQHPNQPQRMKTASSHGSTAAHHASSVKQLTASTAAVFEVTVRALPVQHVHALDTHTTCYNTSSAPVIYCMLRAVNRKQAMPCPSSRAGMPAVTPTACYAARL